MSSGGHQATKINHLSTKFEKRQRNEEENWSLSHFEGRDSRVPTSGSRTLSTGGKSNFALATVMIVQRLLSSVQFSKSSNTKPCQYCQYLLTINLVIFSGSPTDLLNGGKTAMFPKDQQVPPRLRVRQVPAAAFSTKNLQSVFVPDSARCSLKVFANRWLDRNAEWNHVKSANKLHRR